MDAGSVRADDLLMLLAVARTGRYTAAAQLRGVDHTTVARRIAALEEALGGRLVAQSGRGWELTTLGAHAAETAGRIEAAMSQLAAGGVEPDPVSGVVRMSATDGFSAYIAAPAAVEVRRRHPAVSVELIAATRRASEARSGMDIEVVVGQPRVHRAEAIRVAEYCLGLYATRDYLDRHGTPADRTELEAHPLVYFVDSMLRVDDLDLAHTGVGTGVRLPAMAGSVSSTNVFVHVEATRAHAGIGLLPCFMADRHDDLIRVLPDDVTVTLAYWLVARTDTLRRPEVAAVVDAIRAQALARADELQGRAGAAR